MKFNKENMPKHIAIIMDGNRRWARAQGKPASFGHKAGAKTLEKIVRYANKIGLEYITVYAFSTENWKRAEEEVKALMMYNKELAKKIYAAADIFLMPSKSEPCGLSQMVACRYGTVPVVRETGGLKDSIRDCGDEGGFGFTFKTYNAGDMLGAIDRALGAYANSDFFAELRQRCMAEDFSWGRSANEYIRMYRELIKG